MAMKVFPSDLSLHEKLIIHLQRNTPHKTKNIDLLFPEKPSWEFYKLLDFPHTFTWFSHFTCKPSKVLLLAASQF